MVSIFIQVNKTAILPIFPHKLDVIYKVSSHYT